MSGTRDFNNIETRAVIKFFFPPARQGAEGSTRHSDRNISLFLSWSGLRTYQHPCSHNSDSYVSTCGFSFKKWCMNQKRTQEVNHFDNCVVSYATRRHKVYRAKTAGLNVNLKWLKWRSVLSWSNLPILWRLKLTNTAVPTTISTTDSTIAYHKFVYRNRSDVSKFWILKICIRLELQWSGTDTVASVLLGFFRKPV